MDQGRICQAAVPNQCLSTEAFLFFNARSLAGISLSLNLASHWKRKIYSFADEGARGGLRFLLSDFKEIPPVFYLLPAHPPSWKAHCQGWGGRGKPTMAFLV